MKSAIRPLKLSKLNGFVLTFGNSKAQIVSDWGCNVNKLVLNGQSVILGNSKHTELTSNVLCRSDFLIPFPNRIENGRYSFRGKTYQLDKNKKDEGHAIHGLIYNRKFNLLSTIIDKQFVSADFQLEIKPLEFTGYPFHLSIVITLKLSASSLDICIIATNLDVKPIPYGVGWHPYVHTVKKIDSCKLIIPTNSELEVDNKKILIPTGKIIKHSKLKNGLVDKNIFDTCFALNNKFQTKFENIIVFQDPSMKYLQIYTPKDRKSIAIEPMSCSPNAFNNKKGLLEINPLTSVTHKFGIKLS